MTTSTTLQRHIILAVLMLVSPFSYAQTFIEADFPTQARRGELIVTGVKLYAEGTVYAVPVAFSSALPGPALMANEFITMAKSGEDVSSCVSPDGKKFIGPVTRMIQSVFVDIHVPKLSLIASVDGGIFCMITTGNEKLGSFPVYVKNNAVKLEAIMDKGIAAWELCMRYWAMTGNGINVLNEDDPAIDGTDLQRFLVDGLRINLSTLCSLNSSYGASYAQDLDPAACGFSIAGHLQVLNGFKDAILNGNYSAARTYLGEHSAQSFDRRMSSALSEDDDEIQKLLLPPSRAIYCSFSSENNAAAFYFSPDGSEEVFMLPVRPDTDGTLKIVSYKLNNPHQRAVEAFVADADN